MELIKKNVSFFSLTWELILSFDEQLARAYGVV